MLHVVLYQPEIAPNTGNIGRTCAANGVRLHLVHPLGFALSDRKLRRAGMDYWRTLDLVEHRDFEAFRQSPARPRRVWLCTTRGALGLWEVAFADGDGLLFGRESSGCPEGLHAWVGPDHCVRIPQRQAGSRSLNLSTAAGIAVYEALRQLDAAAQ
jgi:tRNA (cytidine/uridine-2'-O-)-methyltransferase